MGWDAVVEKDVGVGMAVGTAEGTGEDVGMGIAVQPLRNRMIRLPSRQAFLIISSSFGTRWIDPILFQCSIDMEIVDWEEQNKDHSDLAQATPRPFRACNNFSSTVQNSAARLSAKATYWASYTFDWPRRSAQANADK